MNVQQPAPTQPFPGDQADIFRLIADSTHDWELWIGPRRELLYVSPACERITGYRPAAFLADPAMLAAIVHPADHEAFSLHTEQELHHPGPLTLEYRIVTRAGEERWLSHVCQPMHGDDGRWLGRRASNRDITDRVRAVEAYRNLVDHSLQGLVIFQDGVLVFANPTACELTGFSMEELLNWHAEDMVAQIHADDRAFVWTRFQARVAGRVEPHHYGFRFIRKDGVVRHWEIYSTMLAYWGRPAIHVTFLDVTDRKQAEAEKDRALAELQDSDARFRQRSTELETLHDLSLQLNSQLDTAALLQLILDQAVALLGVEAGLFFLNDPLRNELCAEIATDYLTDFVGMRLQRGVGLAGEVFESRRSMVVTEYANWTNRIPVHTQRPLLRNLLAVPLLGKDGVLGVLDLGSEEKVFTEHDIWLAEMFAAQATVALERARLLDEVQRQAREMAALNRAGQAVTSLLEREAVLSLVIAETQNLLNADGAWVLLCDEQSAEPGLRIAAARGGADGPASSGLDQMVGAHVPLVASVAGLAVETRQGQIVADTSLAPRFYSAIQTPAGMHVRSLLAAPLVVRDAVIGVIEASKTTPDAFQPRDLAVLERMAAAAAIAIDNARLLEAERQQYHRLQESQTQMVRVEKMAALGRMAAALAHEINNPLQAIQSHVELVMDFPLPPAQQAEFLAVVRTEMARLTEIVQRVLDFSRPTLAPRQPVSVDDLLRRTLALASKQLQRQAVQVSTSLDGRLTVAVGRDQMVQVFLNLVINAVEAIERGGRIDIEVGRQDGYARIDFANDGPPIPDEHLRHVFEPFYTTKADGTGLGLAVSQNLVEQYGGDIAVANRGGGQGVVFTVRLPLDGSHES